MRLKTTAIAFAIAALPAAAFAQADSTARIDQRQHNQQQRIEQGVASGQFTEKEAARMQKGQQRVQRREDKAMADGRMSAKERARIERRQDQQSRHIRRERHDRQRSK
jgi:hypothetical protein